jgi:hypothetical protein
MLFILLMRIVLRAQAFPMAVAAAAEAVVAVEVILVVQKQVAKRTRGQSGWLVHRKQGGSLLQDRSMREACK